MPRSGGSFMLAEMELLVGDLFRRGAAAVPQAPAASLGEAVLSWRRLDEESNRIAAALRARGVRHGDRVVVWCDTALEVVPLFAALAKLGAVFAPLNARHSLEEALPVAELARPRALVVDARRAGDAQAMAKAAGIEAARCGQLAGGGAGDHGLFALDEEARHQPAAHVEEPALRESDPQVLFFTSGSTGAAKGVVLSHRANWLRGQQGVFIDRPEISVCMFPLFHMAAFTLALAAWQTYGEIALCPDPSGDALLATVERRRGSRLYLIPAVWARVLEVPADRYDTSTLREIDTGTSATPPELLEALTRRFPAARTRIYYGSTEVGAGTALSHEDVLRKPGSVGRPVPGVELRLADRDEIAIRSPYLADGYFENPDATAAAFREGWFHTGDRGAIDEDGCLSIVGRLKEVIRTAGESVAPVEVEAVLGDCEGVAEVAVVGVPDPQWGELVCAVVVPEPGPRPTLSGLREACSGRLASFKQPRRLVFADSLPRTAATAQLQRALLVERIATGALRVEDT